MASARSPLPLAPRLTTVSSPQASPDADPATPVTMTANPAAQQHTVSHAHAPSHSTSSSQGLTHPDSAARIRTHPRHLLNRTSQPLATQALSVDPTPSTNRFAAYLPQPPRTSFAPLSHAARAVNRSTSPSNETGSSSTLDAASSSHRGLLGAKLRSHGSHQDSAFEALPQFGPDAEFRGDVLVRCSSCDFYVHKAILYFASPFFRAILDGDWKETHPSLHTISSSEASSNDEDDSISNLDHLDDEQDASQGRGVAKQSMERSSITQSHSSPRASFYTADFTFEYAEQSTQHRSSTANTAGSVTPGRTGDDVAGDEEKFELQTTNDGLQFSAHDDAIGQPTPSVASAQRDGELAGRLERMATPPLPDKADTTGDGAMESRHAPEETTKHVPMLKGKTDGKARRAPRKANLDNITAIIDLSEEDAGTIQDVLCHVYPNLDLLVTWYNIFSLFAFADKFEVPHLRRACTTFLRASLAGRPIEAMALSERHGIEDVYREASRHVLDNMPSWEPSELAVLSHETLLKLERKRTWFLERLLKLGLANPARDYECHAGCPDPQHCAKSLHERWHAQYAAAFKYGPPQPSIIWRHLRELDGGGSSSSAATMTACQASSKAWVQSLFDRMYGLPTHGKTSQKFLAIKLNQSDAPRPRPRLPVDSEAS